MKRLMLCAAALTAALTAAADEGMWTLFDLPQAVYQTMRQEGYALPYSALYADTGAVRHAVVNFSGYCSGVVVSPDGLVLTNHHCGFEAIRSHSTVEHDYMLHGFVAKTLEEELPNENMFVSFMVSQRDVTATLDGLGIHLLASGRRAEVIDSVENALTRQAKAQDSTLHVSVDAFYEGNRYYATTYRDFTDLRLVFTVPKSMGKFGGETDNWMWPRHTCDFSVFRIYADPVTGGPAAYSPRNVPYHPQTWARVSTEGYADGDFAMTLGYPGSTSRYLSSYGIRERRDAINAPMAQVRGVKQEVMQRHMRASEDVRIKYDSKFAQSANYWKNSLGMNKCIDSIGLIRQKQEYEARLARWQDSTGYLRPELSLARLDSLYARRFRAVRGSTLYRETFRRTGELVSRAARLNKIEVRGPRHNRRRQYVLFEDNSREWDEALDREALATLMENYRAQADSCYLPACYQTVESRFGGSCARYVDWLYGNSFLSRSGEKIYINRKSYLLDPGVRLGLDLLDTEAVLRADLEATADSIARLERLLCQAKVRMEEDLPHYSDANFTMRLSHGRVGGFLLGGQPSGYYTAAPGIVEKMRRSPANPDYFAEPEMQELLAARDFGRYRDPRTGEMHLCFLTDNDITGGNSGSPMFDGRGRLIGLAFDGNWDSLSNDLLFDRRLARCIGVDIRYVLYMIDRWGHAPRLLREMGVE